MGFSDAITSCFQKYLEFRGRAGRAEYWYWMLLGFMLAILFVIVDLVVFGVSAGPFSTVAAVVLLLPGLAVTARRLHDIDRSGWWMLIAWVPLIGGIILIVMMCTRGTAGANRFGPEPA